VTQLGAGVDGDFNIYIGAFAGPASGSESETIRIGDVFNTACFIGGIKGQTASGGCFHWFTKISAKVGFTARFPYLIGSSWIRCTAGDGLRLRIHKPSSLLPTESFLSDPSDDLIADDF